MGLGALALTACAPTEAEIDKEFSDVVAQANGCADVSECVVVPIQCPLGCRAVVHRDHATEVESKAQELVASYESSGVSCSNLCPALGALECRAGRCAEAKVP